MSISHSCSIINARQEATEMSEAVKEIFLETAKENGWLDDEFEQDRKRTAKKQ